MATVSLKVLKEREQRDRMERLRRDDDHGVDARALAEELGRRVRGEVRFDAGSRALYATDASNYRNAPIGVVVPRDADDVAEAVAAARKFGAPVLTRGGGTSLGGQCCNVAVVLDTSKYMRRVVKIDPHARLATVEPGCVLDDLQHRAEPHGLIFGPDPATHDRCAIGGMLGNNACGAHSLISKNNGFGLRSSDNTHELEVLTYRGLRLRVGATPPEELDRIIAAGGARGALYARLREFRDRHARLIRERFPKIPRRVSGYNLDELLPENGFHVARALCGSESTLVTFLEATLHLVPNSPVRSLLVLGYADVYAAADNLMDILEYEPIGLEGIDDVLFEFLRKKGEKLEDVALLPEGGYLLAEFGGQTREQADESARQCMRRLENGPRPPSMRLFSDPEEIERIWAVRESGLGATAFVPDFPDTWPGFEDSAVRPQDMADYLHDLRGLMGKFDYRASIYGHFGQGIAHCRIPFDLYTSEGVEKFRRFMRRVARAIAPCRWTWRPTRRSSWRTTTAAGCGRGTPTRSAGSPCGRDWRVWRRRRRTCWRTPRASAGWRSSRRAWRRSASRRGSHRRPS